jgi:hypothetical protein
MASEYSGRGSSLSGGPGWVLDIEFDVACAQGLGYSRMGKAGGTCGGIGDSALSCSRSICRTRRGRRLESIGFSYLSQQQASESSHMINALHDNSFRQGLIIDEEKPEGDTYARAIERAGSAKAAPQCGTRVLFRQSVISPEPKAKSYSHLAKSVFVLLTPS